MAYTAELADAWRRVAESTARSGYDAAMTTFRHEVGAAYLEFVGALKRVWRQVPATRIDPATLAMIGASLSSAGSLTTMALHGAGGTP